MRPAPLARLGRFRARADVARQHALERRCHRLLRLVEHIGKRPVGAHAILMAHVRQVRVLYHAPVVGARNHLAPPVARTARPHRLQAQRTANHLRVDECLHLAQAPLLAHAERVRPGNRALIVDDRAPPFAVHIDAVGRAQQLVARVIHRAAASHVVFQILRGEGGQKLSLEVQVVHQLALKLGKLPMLHLRRGDQTVLRLAEMRLQRLMTRKHVGHELSRLRKQLRRHLRLAQILGHMLIEAVQRVMREVSHLKRPEPLVQVVQAQTPLSEPLVRALQIAFNLGRRGTARRAPARPAAHAEAPRASRASADTAPVSGGSMRAVSGAGTSESASLEHKASSPRSNIPSCRRSGSEYGLSISSVAVGSSR